jgi:hypothetical protein
MTLPYNNEQYDHHANTKINVNANTNANTIAVVPLMT